MTWYNYWFKHLPKNEKQTDTKHVQDLKDISQVSSWAKTRFRNDGNERLTHTWRENQTRNLLLQKTVQENSSLKEAGGKRSFVCLLLF